MSCFVHRIHPTWYHEISTYSISSKFLERRQNYLGNFLGKKTKEFSKNEVFPE